MGILDGWKKRNKPRQQYFGGTKADYHAYQQTYKTGAGNADTRVTKGLGNAQSSADDAEKRFIDLGGDVKSYGREQGAQAQAADAGFQQAMGQYQGGRAGVLNDAAKLEGNANDLQTNYQTTADKQFQINQNRNAQQAVNMGSRGGASSLRQALAGSTLANADAQAQAEVTRAQENNQLETMKQNAITTAAGIRQGQGAQDQNAGQMFTGRQQNAYANQAGANAQRAGLIGSEYEAQAGAANQQTQAGVAQEGNYLGAQQGMETAQLNSYRENEAQRQQRNNTIFNRWQDPFGMQGHT